MKYLLIILLSLSIFSCNDNSIDYDDIYAQAGDELLEIENDGYHVTLDADAPKSDQIGFWLIVTGDNGYFADSSLYNTEFYGEPGQTYVLEWTASNEVESVSDRTTVSFKAMTPEMYMILSDTIENMYLDLYGKLPRHGARAEWKVLVGDSGKINNADSHEATLWGLPNTKYQVQYSHIYGDAIESEVFDVTLGDFQAFAGLDRSVTPSTSTDPDQKIVTLWASLPYGAEGQWKIISGENGEVLIPDDANSLFRGAPEETYTLEWHVEYNGLSTSDTVEFSIMGQWGRFIDPADDEEYKTVIIGDLEWMAENYRRTYTYGGVEEGNWWYGLSYNSEMISRVINDVKIPGNVVDTDEERRYYGKLYPIRYAQALAPDGWRLPSGAEFLAMVNEFGGVHFAGVRLQKGGISGLDFVSGGFYAPADYMGYGQFASQDEFGAYWIDQEMYDDTQFAIYYLSYSPAIDDEGNEIIDSNEGLTESITSATYALSVRYVRDVN